MRDLDDLFLALARSKFRRKFALNAADAKYFRERGLDAVMQHAARLIGERLAPASPRNDGKQTPWRGHPVFVAQHATATCCRGCLSKWHAIDKGRELKREETDYVLSVLRRWLATSAPPAAESQTLFENFVPREDSSRPTE
jgi:hypothetical protein